MARYLVQVVRQFELEVEASSEAVALALAQEQFEGKARETVYIDTLVDELE